jgi:polygalacturonase
VARRQDVEPSVRPARLRARRLEATKRQPAQQPTSRWSDGDRPSARRGCLIFKQQFIDQVTGQDQDPTARNTDGIDPDSSTNVTVNDSFIQDGDDGIAIKTNASAASDITIENSHFYGTHGISIGSETQFGVSNVLIENDTIQGTDSSGNESTSNNGIRIKTDSSDGGKVNDITYDDICETGVQDLIDFNPLTWTTRPRVPSTRTSASLTPTSPRPVPA